MRAFGLLALGIVAATAALLALTLGTALGSAILHYNVAFVATGATLLAAAPLLRRRRATSLLLGYSGVLATLTGFAMLYTIEFVHKGWLTWWHGVTSVVFMGAFLAHWALNHVRLAGFARRLAGRARAGVPVAGAWGLGLGVGAMTWSPDWRLAFTSENYLYLSSWAILVGAALPYALWLLFRLPSMQARLARPRPRATARALVDTSLWLACWLALLTGFALLYLAEPLRSGDLKHVSKWWHTATSVAFLSFAALHAGFNARILAAHARRVDNDLRR